MCPWQLLLGTSLYRVAPRNIREATRHHTPPLSATQLTVDLRFKESLLRMYKMSCWWASGTKHLDHRVSLILLKGQRPLILLQQSRCALFLFPAAQKAVSYSEKGTRVTTRAMRGQAATCSATSQPAAGTAWPRNKLTLQERHTLSRAFLSDGLPPDINEDSHSEELQPRINTLVFVVSTLVHSHLKHSEPR